MTDTALAGTPDRHLDIAPNTARIQNALLWLVGFGGAVVFIEPSPFEFAILASVVVFALTGMRMRPAVMLLAALLFVLNLGYTISGTHLLDQKPIVNWIMTSWYLMISAIFFAMAMCENTAARLDMLCRGLVVGAVITAFAGVIAYLGLLPSSLAAKLTLYGRAAGMFKDPNVFGAYLVLPALLVMQRIVSINTRHTFLNVMLLGIITLGIFLAFSRAAWGLLVMSAAMMLAMTAITSPSNRERTRIILLAIAGAVGAAAILTILLSFDFIGDMFEQRASLKQGYDSGRFGRFGRHLLGAQMALELPLGIGPLQFSRFFPEDTHNSYLNAFMSGGWISGIVFPSLVLITLYQGLRTVLIRTPWQRSYIAVYAAFVGTIGEAAIIDVDHWRHFWMMLGLVWGLSIATHKFIADRAQLNVHPIHASYTRAS